MVEVDNSKLGGSNVLKMHEGETFTGTVTIFKVWLDY